MTYKIKPSPKVEAIFKKMAQKDPVRLEQIHVKLKEVAEQPDRYKFLRNKLKGENRLHFGHHVLTYDIYKAEELIYLLDYDHHDNVYKKR